MKFLIFFALCVGVAVAQYRPNFYNKFNNNYNRNYNGKYYDASYVRNAELEANAKNPFLSNYYNKFNSNYNRDYNYNSKYYEPNYVKNVGPEVNAKTVKENYELSPDGTYSHGFETDNGIVAQAQGTPKALGGNPPEVAELVQGQFAWTSPEGQFISYSYTADENGYHPLKNN